MFLLKKVLRIFKFFNDYTVSFWFSSTVFFIVFVIYMRSKKLTFLPKFFITYKTVLILVFIIFTFIFISYICHRFINK